METPADTIKKDTIATAVLPVEETVTETAPADEKIVVKPQEGKEIKVQYATFGSKISADKALTQEQMMKKYASLKKGDTINVKFRSKITDVCKKKGCWMSMELPNSKESFVRFKDYGFFVPLNADNSEAIVSGKAFLDVVSVDELRHYAKDGGKSQEEIEKITQPKVTYAFTADGVLIEQ
ncbi:DUF4920 domain-containing protein [Flavobacterium magnum]|uniref:DUF4920 domain-containing protein n=2 Tax=Flavobacterium magnum TaxID=2162713 RepID=A0A2S0RJP8_9FLAO|nr:DUF4920 domain-containing protein [Flavobacterium magnum]